MKSNLAKKCFVCEKELDQVVHKNKVTLLPVCNECKGSVREKAKEQEMLDSLADGFVCGCI
ncbi:hypothetical protein [Saccharicrinis fermentans]|uniref:Uncharacterized protein n=1 Tax=Saccharicrinis fermentans DSM 9555 = JCM 21142 TaxID=869213 RepID=W7XX26_9BACT|nr:hypothetical protein [Saccharicrinis fermentans]GAF02990.1 hypothetical protein JCM21142_41642 [Saccharicrinis fermentans DSM 9555 = JCM 21142]